MPRLLPVILMLCMLFPANQTQATPPTDGQRFTKYLNKYPSEMLKAEPDAKRRLQALLGANYKSFMERLQTEMLMENKQGILVGWGCKAHECGEEMAFFFINLSDGKIHCAIRSESYSNKVKTFSEDPQHFPSAALKEVLNQ